MNAYLVQIIAAYFVGIFYCLSVESPRRMVFWIAIISTIGWWVYLMSLNDLQFGVVPATYISSVVIASLSHLFSRWFKEPVTIFFIPGFVTLVPGGGMYRTVLNMFQGNYWQGARELGTTLFIALAIALAVFTVDSTIQIIYGQKFPKFVRINRLPLKLKRRPRLKK